MNISPIFSSALASLQPQISSSQLGSCFDFSSALVDAVSSQSSCLSATTSDLLNSFMQNCAPKTSALHAGRNMSLFDPEAAYKMMTLINNKNVLYQAQFSELSQMGSAVTKMQETGQSLGNITLASSNDAIESSVQDFTNQYNNWIQRFNPDMQDGGLLAGTQAAQMSRYELEQSVGNILNGAMDGLHGLGDLGISIDPASKTLSLDNTKLLAMLTANKQGVIDTVQDFSANFSKSAGLLNADNNFIPNQLDNLNRAIHYISDNNAAWKSEFGTGDSAQPSGQVALALATYQQSYQT